MGSHRVVVVLHASRALLWPCPYRGKHCSVRPYILEALHCSLACTDVLTSGRQAASCSLQALCGG